MNVLEMDYLINLVYVLGCRNSFWNVSELLPLDTCSKSYDMQKFRFGMTGLYYELYKS